MSDAASRDEAATLSRVSAPKVGKSVALGSLMALTIVAIMVGSWSVFAQVNARLHPEVPWAALATACLLVMMILWLGGFIGWPRGTSAWRRHHLRLWRPQPGAWSGENLMTILGLAFAVILLTIFWILVQVGRPPIDVSPYPTTAFRFSVLIMGAVVSGVGEEIAFRGYMQSYLEPIGPTFAILVTSVVFTLLHASHGLAYLLSVAPGFFVISVIYGYLALKSGSIIPGMILHSVGDAAITYFVLLGGDHRLLFA